MIKYIKTKDRVIIAFPEAYSHKEVAEKFGGALSAGFITFNGEDTKCSGESYSLKIKSDKEDSYIAVRQFFYM